MSSYHQGKIDGYNWAVTADRNTLKVALGWVPFKYDPTPNLIGYDPFETEGIGDYFRDVLGDDDKMAFETTIGTDSVPNKYFANWEAGWTHGVKEYWDDIKKAVRANKRNVRLSA